MNSNNTFNKSKNYAQHISKPLFALFQSFFKNPLYELKIRKKYTIYKPSDLDIYFRYSFVELSTEFPSETTTPRLSNKVIVSFPKHMKNIGVFIISKDAEIDNSNLYFFPLTQKNLYVYKEDNDLNYYYIKIKDLGYIYRLNNYNYSYQEFLRWVGEENHSKLNESFYNPTISGAKFISHKTHIRPATDQEIEEIYSPPKKEIISNMTNNNENTFVIERKKTLKYKNLPEITIDFSENESNNIFYQEGKYPYTSVNIDITIEKDECNKEKIEDLKVLITKALDEIIEN